MNRIVIIALAAALSHFTLACAAETSAPSQNESGAETASVPLDEEGAIEVTPIDEELVDHAFEVVARDEEPFELVRAPTFDKELIAPK